MELQSFDVVVNSSQNTLSHYALQKFLGEHLVPLYYCKCYGCVQLAMSLSKQHNHCVHNTTTMHTDTCILSPSPLDAMDPSLSAIGSVLTVNIEPSDDAFGRFGFTPESQSRVVVEQSGGTPVTLTVTRQGGSFGDVSVYWSVSQSGGMPAGSAMDISPGEGVLEFIEGQNEMDISLVVNDDLVSL